MKALPVVVLALVVATAAHAQHHGHAPAPAKQGPIPYFGLTMVNHPVSTANPDAQKAFDQGLALCYGFNHDEAIRAFERAATLDPDLAMAHWGVALALGPNINMPMTPEAGQMAWAALQRAIALKPKASPAERDYIDALATRYVADPETDRTKHDADYAEAMGKLSARYPDDLDAATLYAEAMMDLRPWALWERDGTPAPGTEKIVEVLESVLRRNPDHLGANHYYIHAVEASKRPERARGAAESLRALAPNTGHLMHMPSHIDARMGDFDRVAKQNERATAVDRAYVSKEQPAGLYPAMYYSHNMHFAAYGHAMAGRYGPAMKYARDLSRHVGPMVPDMLMLELFTPTETYVNVMFGKWKELLSATEPSPTWPVTHAMWRFGRGMALASTGSPDEAKGELQGLRSEMKNVPTEALVGVNTAAAVLEVAERMLQAKVHEARGETAQAIESLNAAVKAEDTLAYDEPPDWYLHSRIALGGLLLRSGQPARAEEVFRAALDQQPRQGRALFGLARALEAQKKSYDAAHVDRQLGSDWFGEPLAIEDL